ncbi:hypothetical protein G9A89_016964 [Geosiphon pyriformis]|nr:hypothetical protein G9A89_016964 [Geosiphon pyriformis]
MLRKKFDGIRISTNNNHPKYSQQLGLNNNHFLAKSTFNFYINNKITDCLGGTIKIESTRENFYTELFQHTSLSRNYSFAPIIRKINQTIEKYTQQQFPITYADKGKGRLQTPAKKTRVESPTNPLYYYTPESAINISLTDVFTLHTTSTFGQLLFQSKQKKAELLRTYSFGNAKSEYQNPKLSDSARFKQNLSLVIIINQPLIVPILEPIPQPPLQQSIQPSLQQTPTAATTAITTTATTTTTIELRSNSLHSNNETRKQRENEAVTTYLRHFHRNLHQIQAIQADYFTAPQILNQFIRDLYTAVTNARDFEAAKLKANYAQAVNLMINGSSKLDSKLKQFIMFLIIIQSAMAARDAYLPLLKPIIRKLISKLQMPVSNSELPIQPSTISINLPANDTTTNISTIHILASSLSTANTNNISTTIPTNIY